MPRGVAKGTWDYIRANNIAEGYDDFLLDDPLTKVDRQIIDRYLPEILNPTTSELKPKLIERPLVADFGCGTGRSLLPILHRGFRGLGIDLSIPMLQAFKEKSALFPEVADRITLLNANLVEMDGLKDNSVDHGVCMFSTLGMIKGLTHRSTFLNHVRRVIKPGGHFIVHAHNVWYQSRFPGGIRQLLGGAWSHLRRRSEFGDRTASYRNVNQMFIHSFCQNELRNVLDSSGFEKQTWFGVEANSIEMPVELGSRFAFAKSCLKMVGWIVVCQ